MKIWTELEPIKGSGQTKVGVHIEANKRDADNIIDHILDGAVATMEIVGILNALKEYDKVAFNVAMEHFIEEELAKAEEDEDDE